MRNKMHSTAAHVWVQHHEINASILTTLLMCENLAKEMCGSSARFRYLVYTYLNVLRLVRKRQNLALLDQRYNSHFLLRQFSPTLDLPCAMLGVPVHYDGIDICCLIGMRA